MESRFLNTRRQFVSGVAALGGTLGFAQHALAQEATPSTSGEWTEPDWSPDPLPFKVVERTDTTVTVETELDGTLELPADAGRIVCMYGGEDRFIALGLGDRVVSVVSFDGENPTFTSDADFNRYLTNPDMYIAPNNGQPDMEELIELAPDLIVGPTALITDEYYATLSAIAPTIRATYNPLRGSLTAWGDYFGLQDLAAAQIANLDDYATRARAEVQPVIGDQKTAVVFYMQPDVLYAILAWDSNPAIGTYVSNAYGAPFYRELGLRPTDFVENIADETGRENMQYGGLLTLSSEQMGKLDADFLFMVVASEGSRAEVTEVLQSDPVYHAIPAVENNQAYVITTEEFSGGYLATYRAIQLAVATITHRPLI